MKHVASVLACVIALLPSTVLAQTTAHSSGGPTASADQRLKRLVSSISEERLQSIVAKLASFGTRETLSDTSSSTRGIGAAIARLETVRRNMWPARVESRGACVDGGALMTWEAMRSLRVGLLVALAHPERVVRWLGRRGVVPRAIVRARDHGPFGGRSRVAAFRAGIRGVDVWLATPKCALHAAAAGLSALPLAVLDHSLVLHPRLRNHLRAIADAACLTGAGGTNSLELLESTRIVRGVTAPCMPSARPLAASGGMMMMRPRA